MTPRVLTLGLVVAGLWALLLVTAVGCVWARHEARALFVELRTLERERDRLEVEWNKLRIEQSAWATHARVENLAREELGMIVPRSADVAVLEP